MDSNATVETMYALGRWLLDGGRAQDAVHVFRAMLVAAPADQRGWLGLGTCHEVLAQDDTALELYALATRACTAGRCLAARGRLLAKLDRDDEAAEAYEAAVSAAEAEGDGDLLTILAAERGTA